VNQQMGRDLFGRPKMSYNKHTCKSARKCGGVIDHWRNVVAMPTGLKGESSCTAHVNTELKQ